MKEKTLIKIGTSLCVAMYLILFAALQGCESALINICSNWIPDRWQEFLTALVGK